MGENSCKFIELSLKRGNGLMNAIFYTHTIGISQKMVNNFYGKLI